MNHFLINNLIRVLSISLTSFILVLSLQMDDRAFTSALLLILILIQIYLLYRYINKTNRTIIQFLNQIKSKSNLDLFKEDHPNSSFGDLNINLNSITRELSRANQQSEIDQEILYQVITHIDHGIICFNSNGKPIFHNTQILEILEFENVPDLNQLHLTLKQLNHNTDKGTPSQADTKECLVKQTTIGTKDGELILFSVQNISNELQKKEVESFQKLIGVLSHEIKIHDNGPGISKENIDKVFTPFFSTKARRGKKNSGIGLSISRKIIQAHGGTVSLKSSEKGTEVTIFLPNSRLS